MGLVVRAKDHLCFIVVIHLIRVSEIHDGQRVAVLVRQGEPIAGRQSLVLIRLRGNDHGDAPDEAVGQTH
jgi:hypothetical protein